MYLKLEGILVFITIAFSAICFCILKNILQARWVKGYPYIFFVDAE